MNKLRIKLLAKVIGKLVFTCGILAGLSSCAAYCPEHGFIDPVTGKCVCRAVDNPPQYKPRPSKMLSDWLHLMATYSYDEKDMTTFIAIEYVVDKNGKVSGVRIVGKDNDELTSFEKAAVAAFSQLNNWRPGSWCGKKVNVLMRAPIHIDFSRSQE